MSTKGFANGQNDNRRGIDFIGVSCSFVCHDGNGKVLMHKRSKNCRDEQGLWDNGGGAHEFGDDIEQTIKREIKEEYDADAFNLQFIKVYDAHRKLLNGGGNGIQTHWVVIVYVAQVDPTQAKNNEPHKIDDIGWFTLDNLPSPLHSQTKHTLDSVKAAGAI